MGKMGVLSFWHFCQKWYLNHWMIPTNATAVICCSVLIISDWDFQWQQAENLISLFKGWSSEFEESKQLCSIYAWRLPFSVWWCKSEKLKIPLIGRKNRERLTKIYIYKPHHFCTWHRWGNLVSKKLLCWLTGGSQASGSRMQAKDWVLMGTRSKWTSVTLNRMYVLILQWTASTALFGKTERLAFSHIPVLCSNKLLERRLR